jgi:Tfp pilus assembly protein PilO
MCPTTALINGQYGQLATQRRAICSLSSIISMLQPAKENNHKKQQCYKQH